MSDEINATRAMDIANQAMQKAGWTYKLITGVRKENTHWIVTVFTLGGGYYIVKINASTGEIVELSTVKR